MALVASSIQEAVNEGYDIAFRAVQYRDVFFGVLTVIQDFLDDVIAQPAQVKKFTDHITPLLHSRQISSLTQVFRELKVRIVPILAFLGLILVRITCPERSLRDFNHIETVYRGAFRARFSDAKQEYSGPSSPLLHLSSLSLAL